MDFLTLVQRFVRLSDMATSGPSTTESQTGDYLEAINYVQDAHAEVQSAFFDWNFLWGTDTLTTSVGVSSYAGVSGLGIWDKQRVFYNGNVLPVIDWPDYAPETIENGPPQYAVLRPDNRLLLVPTPDAAYTISYDYFKSPKVLSSNTDTPLIPEQFRLVIVGRALKKYALFESAPETLALGEQMDAYWMDQLQKHELPRRQQTHGRAEPEYMTMVVE